MSLLDFGCNDSACYIFNACDSDNPSRILHLAFVEKSYGLDKTDADALIESFWTAELEGKARIIRSITGEKPRPETQELQGFGRQSVKVGSSNHTINFMDQHVVQNLDFYNTFKFASGKYDLYYFTDGICWDASGNLVVFYGDPVFTNGPTDLIMGEATIKWVSKTSPTPYPEAFDTDALEEGLFYEITAGGAADAVGRVTMETGATENVTLSAALNQYLPNSCTLQWAIVDFGDVVMVTPSINSTTGALTLIGGGAGPGSSEIKIKVTNDCGGCVEGTITVVVTIIDP